ncbi:MAG: acyl-CoA dehydrogenase [Candidatus Eisenbacteria bacterium]|nr:acyl-CoA dehydrogenase [Candidatus Eisenbacteria bacterium]
MDEILSQENREYRARTREFAEKVIRPVAAEYDRKQEYPWEIHEALKKAGLTGVWIPKEYGGHGAGLLNLCIVIEELSRACGGIGVAYAVNALGSFPILLAGTEEQKKKYLTPVARGEAMISFGLSERDAGSDAGSLRCSARRDGDHYILNGHKKWNTNGGIATYYTVFCRTDPASKGPRGLSAIVVEKPTPGFSIGKIEDKMGIRCVPVVELEFDNCRVPAANMLGEEGKGFRIAMETLDRARPGVAAQAVGLAQGAMEVAIRHTSERRQFDVQILSFQGIQWMVADMGTQTEAARQLVYTTARAVDAQVKNISKISAMCKVFATDTAMKVTTDAVQLMGGYGFMKDFPAEKYMRDAKITQIYEGTNQVQRIVISRAMIKELGVTV